LIRDRAIIPRVRVPRGHYAFAHDALMVRGRVIIVHMISSQTPAADLPYGAVIFIMIG
jgi:hypothetical protein